MNFKKKYKFDNTNTLLLLTDENNIKKYNDLVELIGNLKKNKKEFGKHKPRNCSKQQTF